MRRTLLAVGIAVLSSMMLIPRGHVDIGRYGHAMNALLCQFKSVFEKNGIVLVRLGEIDGEIMADVSWFQRVKGEGGATLGS